MEHESDTLRRFRHAFTRRQPRFLIRLGLISIILFSLLVGARWLLSGNGPSDLERVLQRGEVIMLTRNSASTYFEDVDGPAGLDYELMRGFAEYLGVTLTVEVRGDITELLPALSNHEGDLVAAGITVTPQRQQDYRFGPVYQETTPIVVYRRGQPKPKSISDIANSRVGISSGSSYIQQLQKLQTQIPELSWQELDKAGIEDLMQMISSNELDYSIIDSTDLTLNQPFFPYVEAAFEFTDTDQLAWLFRGGHDDTLVNKARTYFFYLNQNEILTDLQTKYSTPDNNYNVVNTITFQERIRDRLPQLRGLFELAAINNNMDWRLLAAVGYQESHWDPAAVSPTGVRGIMMLTQSTAKDLNVSDREDPAQSIDGGTRYLRNLISTLPERISEQDRIYMALAAYNIGYGHLEDARILTQRQGGDPDTWDDVRERLPLLTRQSHYQDLKYGYARGTTAVRYVDNIRAYHDILTWMDTRNHPLVSWDADTQAET